MVMKVKVVPNSEWENIYSQVGLENYIQIKECSIRSIKKEGIVYISEYERDYLQSMGKHLTKDELL